MMKAKISRKPHIMEVSNCDSHKYICTLACINGYGITMRQAYLNFIDKWQAAHQLKGMLSRPSK